MYSYEEQSADVAGKILAGFGAIWFIYMVLCIFLLICMYKVYKKAGRKGWESLIPIYNLVVMIQIAELPIWYIVLFFIPFANIYAMFKIYIEFAHKFGKSTGFGVLMVFLSYICFPILAFGNAQYQGSMSMNTGYNPNQNNMQPYPNIGMNNAMPNNNFNVTPNNYNGNVNGVSNQMNNNLQPELAVAPVAPMPTNFESNNQAVNLEQPNVVAPVQMPESVVQNTVADVQQPSVVETLVGPTVEPVVSEAQPISVADPVPTEPQVIPVESDQANKKFCPNCGNQVDQNDAICFMCGNKF